MSTRGSWRLHLKVQAAARFGNYDCENGGSGAESLSGKEGRREASLSLPLSLRRGGLKSIIAKCGVWRNSNCLSVCLFQYWDF